jgi:hypothetical protein
MVFTGSARMLRRKSLPTFQIVQRFPNSKGDHMTSIRIATRTSILVILLLILGGLPAFAQFLSGIEGTVKDANGALVPGATVTVTDTRLGIAKTDTTSQAGYFRFDSIAASDYAVQIKATGFKTWEQKDLLLAVGETRTLAPVLQVGAVATEVTVNAEEVTVDLASAKTESVIPEATVEETPLSGQNVYGLAALTPAMTGAATQSGADNFTNEYAINVNAVGLRQEQNGYEIDGAQTNTPSRGGGSSISPNPEIVESIEVRTNDFDAQKGRNAGATIDVFTKSGSNKLHGTIDWEFTNNHMTAHKWFDGSASLPTSQRNDMSATLGGPLFKNKLFWFGAIEVLRSSVTTSGTATVETEDLFNWVKANEPNTVAYKILTMAPPLTYAPSAGALTVAQVQAKNPGNPIFPALTICPANPTPGCIDSGMDVLGSINYTNVAPKNGYQWSFRLDDYLTKNDRIYLDGMRTWYQDSSANARPVFNAPDTGSSDFANLDWTHTFSAHLLNEAGANIIRPYGQNGATPQFQIPNINVNGGLAGYGGWGPGNFTQQTIAWRDVLTSTIKTHTLKFGFDQFNVREDDAQGGAFDRATYNFDSLLDFIQDDVTSENGTPVSLVTHQEAPYERRYRALYTGAFVQDDWKVMPTLTINAGVRFDEMQNFFSIYSPTLSKFDVASGSTLASQVSGGVVALAPNPHVLDHSIYGFGPRVGFSWDVSRKGKTAVRGGAGMFNDQPPYLHMTDLTATNLPNFYFPGLNASSSGGVVTSPTLQLCSAPAGFTISCPVLPTPYATINSTTGALYLNGALTRSNVGGIDPQYKLTQVFDWTLSVQHELMQDLTLEVNYSGSASHHLPIYNENLNRFAGDLLKNNTGANPNPTAPSWSGLNPNFEDIQYATSDGNAIGHAISAVATRRMSHGLALHGVYNVAKSMDTQSNSASLDSGAITQGGQNGPIVQNGNLKAQRGRSDFDIRQQFAADGIWMLTSHSDNIMVRDVLGGWQLGGTWIVQTGLPFWVSTNAPFTPVCGGNAGGSCYDAGSNWIPGSVITANAANGGNFNADGESSGDSSSGVASPMVPTFGTHLSGQKKSAFHNGLFAGGASAFPVPALGQEGTLGRNTYDNQGYDSVNFTAAKFFSAPWFFGEKLKFEAKGEFFNVFNRANLTGVDGNMPDGNFGKATNQLPARNIQLHLRASF